MFIYSLQVQYVWKYSSVTEPSVQLKKNLSTQTLVLAWESLKKASNEDFEGSTEKQMLYLIASAF